MSSFFRHRHRGGKKSRSIKRSFLLTGLVLACGALSPVKAAHATEPCEAKFHAPDTQYIEKHQDNATLTPAEVQAHAGKEHYESCVIADIGDRLKTDIYVLPRYMINPLTGEILPPRTRVQMTADFSDKGALYTLKINGGDRLTRFIEGTSKKQGLDAITEIEILVAQQTGSLWRLSDPNRSIAKDPAYVAHFYHRLRHGEALFRQSMEQSRTKQRPPAP